MAHRIALFAQLIVLTALVLVPRCANWHSVFVAGHVYFTDADCYARMTRVRICAEHPGTVLRHHDFENFPAGTIPHTTVPLDYLIFLLALALKPFTTQPIDVAGAFVAPLLAVVCAWFLWWWLRGMKLRYGWVALLLFAVSPILVHGTELGRPDHQALVLVAVTIALCAEWSLQIAPTYFWSLTSGIAWGMALWVSLYEPGVLLGLVLLVYAVSDRRQFTSQTRRSGWIALVVILAIAFVVERRASGCSIPSNKSTPNELGAHDWRADASARHRSGLASVVRVDASRDAVASGVCMVEEKIRRAQRPRSADADDPVGRFVCVDALAGSLGIFFCAVVCACAAVVARAVEVACRRLDSGDRFVFSDPAILGRADLA